ncbi:MAG: hypothetical protein ACKO6N_25425 [Myxococcota bacterium]
MSAVNPPTLPEHAPQPLQRLVTPERGPSGGYWLLALLPLVLSLGWAVWTLEAQERAVQQQAVTALQQQLAHQEAWRRWQPTEPILTLLEQGLPWERQLRRQVLQQYAFQLEYLPPSRLSTLLPGFPSMLHVPRRIEDEGFLVRHTYVGVPPAALLRLELALLAWSRVPIYRLRPALSPTLADAVALQTELADALRTRCPAPCPPLSGGDEVDLELRLLALLDGGDEVQAAHALDLLLERGPALVPLLEVRLEQRRTRRGQTLAFLGLAQLLPRASQRNLLARALRGEEPGLQLLAMLEALRTDARELLPFPPGTGHALPVGEAAQGYLERLLERRGSTSP